MGFVGRCFHVHHKDSKKEIPLFNLDISLDEWQGPFKYFETFLVIAKIAEEKAHLRGNHYVTSKGKIMGGLVNGLHTFEASIDLYQKDHLHYGKRGVLTFEDSARICPEYLPETPRYTLVGLYETIPENERDINSKIERLFWEFPIEMEIKKSIAKNPKTLLKLLENKYRREISDQ